MIYINNTPKPQRKNIAFWRHFPKTTTTCLYNALHPHLNPKTIMYSTAWVLEIFSQTNMSNPSQEYYDCCFIFILKLKFLILKKMKNKNLFKTGFWGPIPVPEPLFFKF
jgi:hypothetical protein